MSKITRRGFGTLLAASAAGAQQSGNRPAPGTWTRPLVPETPAFSGPLEFTRKPVAPKAEPFPMTQVRLLPGSVYHDA